MRPFDLSLDVFACARACAEPVLALVRVCVYVCMCLCVCVLVLVRVHA